MKTASCHPLPESWRPPSDLLSWREDRWLAPAVSAVSYPAAGNDTCFQIEDTSYWFQHRNRCLAAIMGKLPPDGTLFDIGGGNGLVSVALQSSGFEVALVEPGLGAGNAIHRGVRHVIQATLADAGFHARSLPAAGAFDVIEHIADDLAFLRSLRGKLVPGGRFYCTVPALNSLWSAEDVYAGHFRRYNRSSLVDVVEAAGFSVEFVSYFFSWLVPPAALLRAVPSRLGLKDPRKLGTLEAAKDEHYLPAILAGVVGRIHDWELQRIRARRPLACGTSLLCVARANHS